MKLDGTVGLDAPGLKGVQRPVGSATGHLRKGKSWDRGGSTDVLGRDAAPGQIQTGCGYQQGAALSGGAPAHLSVAARVHTNGRSHDVLRYRNGCSCRLRSAEQSRRQDQKDDGFPAHPGRGTPSSAHENATSKPALHRKVKLGPSDVNADPLCSIVSYTTSLEMVHTYHTLFNRVAQSLREV